MARIDELKKGLIWITGLMATFAAFLFSEGSLMATTKIYGPVKATAIRILFTIPLSWLAIYLWGSSGAGLSFRKWLAAKEALLSNKANLALRTGKTFAVLNTAIFLGPILASIFMLMLGIQMRRAYMLAGLLAVFSAGVWCSIYSGVFWSFERLMHFVASVRF